MPVVLSDRIDNKEGRKRVAYLEAFARTLSGIAPWLNTEGGSAEETNLRNQYRQWALQSIANAVNPAAKDYMKWDGGQPLVDASFFALGLIRCPWLWQHLNAGVQQQVIAALKITRQTIPAYTNWILFSAMIEAFFCNYDIDYDPVRIEYGVRTFAQHWYTGDGLFADGMHFAFDYYNSYVIQPYLSTIVQVVNNKRGTYKWYTTDLDKITKRYAVIQERLIHTDGSFPVTGRSIVYRSGAFHHLAYMAYSHNLPGDLPKPQVRSALTAVIKKTLQAPNTFNGQGWLQIGLAGHQPDLADSYINTGSLYLAATVFLPLGLSANDEFWSGASMPWTAVKVWSGGDLPADHSLDLKR